jgi:hypothetical protein
MKKPYEWQKQAIAKKTGKEFFMLNCSCGLGKTYTFIEIVRDHKNAKLIIAPKNICRQWKDELVDEGIDPEAIWVYDQPEASKKPVLYNQLLTDWIIHRGQYLIVPTQSFGLNVKQHKTKGVGLLPFPVQLYLGQHKKKIFAVLDESSWIKANTPSKKQLSARSQMIGLLGSLVENRAAGTGTMMSKSPMNLYDQFNFLKPKFFPETRNEFYQKYTITKMYYYSGRTTVTAINKEEFADIQTYLRNPNWGLSEFTGKDKDRDYNKLWQMAAKYKLNTADVELIVKADRYWPYRNLDELYNRIAPYTVTVKREDVFDISNDKFVYDPIAIPVELTAEQKKLYNKLVKDGFSEEFYLGKAQAAELNTRLQDICIGFEPLKDEEGVVNHRPFKENPKLNALMDLLDRIDENEQVVIWCSRTNAVNSIKEKLIDENISFVVYTGAEDKEEKRLAEEKMKDKSARVFLGNVAAGGFGLNALKDCNYMIWYCVNDSPEQLHQAQHRILRGESKNPKFAYSLFCSHTVEIKQFNSNKNGEEFIKYRNTKEDFLYDEV